MLVFATKNTSGIARHRSWAVMLAAGLPVVVSRTWQVIGSLVSILGSCAFGRSAVGSDYQKIVALNNFVADFQGGVEGLAINSGPGQHGGREQLSFGIT